MSIAMTSATITRTSVSCAGVWLSRLMFNPFVGWPAETRTFEEFEEASRER